MDQINTSPERVGGSTSPPPDDDDGLGLSIYYVIRNGGGVFPIYYNITVLKGKWKVIFLFQL